MKRTCWEEPLSAEGWVEQGPAASPGSDARWREEVMPGRASGEVMLLRRRRQNSQSGYARPVFGSQRPVSPSASQVPLRGERAAEGCALGVWGSRYLRS
ncbi:hypothetical protein [Mesotoga sp. Brook.08.YT.4.2.5.1]|uniref:hypothetical protein n=1 Tax=Mesotoga sp. Brook.08.YT.4.2.5.1 TaxID=1421001 RepID=UPI0015E0A0BF|nr:hypothetical protein [Mesotoga sp. Brook.08.YT.4.2.5.1]